MDSTSIEIFEYAFDSGLELGTKIIIGVAVIAILIVAGKLMNRSI